MADYTITNKAADDLRSIWNYTYDKWSEHQADLYFNALITEFQNIANDKNSQDKEYYLIQSGLFCRRCRKHLIFYKHSYENNIKIIRVLHAMMDIESKF